MSLRPFPRPGVALVTGVVVALVVVLPLLAPGFVLTYDLAAVPRPRISSDLLGLGTSIPRGVPFGLLATLAAHVVTGQVVEKVMLLSVFGLAAWGAARLVPSERPTARVAAGVLYAWNPFVYERILLGHAPFLLSYALLPWVVGAALRLRRGERGGLAGLVVAIGATAFASSYGGVFAVILALAVVASPPYRRSEHPWPATLRVLGAGVVLNLPWLIPALLRPGGLPSSSLAFDLFRSRSDSPLGLVGSLLSLGGLWRTDLAPPARDTLAWIPAFLVILAVALAGWGLLRRRWPLGAVVGLALVTVLGVVLAIGVSVPLIGPLVRWLGVHVPGGGILRDGQKFVAPLTLSLAVGFGLGVERVLGWLGDRRTAPVVAVALVVLPIALVPTLAWGASGRLFTAEYPDAWNRARSIMAADPAAGAVLILPWHLYLPYGWNRDRVVIQPGLVYFTRPAVVNDSLEVGREVVPPEDPWSALADPVVRGGGSLAPSLPGLGVRYVLVVKEADWRDDAGRLSGLRPLLRSPDLDLYRSPVPASVPVFPTAPVAPVVAGDILALGLFLFGLAGLTRRLAMAER